MYKHTKKQNNLVRIRRLSLNFKKIVLLKYFQSNIIINQIIQVFMVDLTEEYRSKKK